MSSVNVFKTFIEYHLDMTRRIWDSIDQINEVTFSFPPADFSATTARASKAPRNHPALEDVQGLEV